MSGDLENQGIDLPTIATPLEPDERAPFHAIGATVRGASHLRNGLPNQDAWGKWSPVDGGWPLAVALADGHGSAKSPRSDRGSRFACQVGIEAGREWLESAAARQLSAEELKYQLEDRVPKQIVARWRELVDKDIANEPVLPEPANPYVVYGSTLLLFLSDKNQIALLQLGDGEILVARGDDAPQRVMRTDDRLIANETTSLSSKEAWREFRAGLFTRAEMDWRLAILTTDGYPNSFGDDAGFLKAGSDIQTILKLDGVELLAAELEGWLRQASALGSGDDCTLVAILKG